LLTKQPLYISGVISCDKKSTKQRRAKMRKPKLWWIIFAAATAYFILISTMVSTPAGAARVPNFFINLSGVALFVALISLAVAIVLLVAEKRRKQAIEYYNYGLHAMSSYDWISAKNWFMKAKALKHADAEAKYSETVRLESEQYYNSGLHAMGSYDWAGAKHWFSEARKLGHMGAEAMFNETVRLESEACYNAGLQTWSSDDRDGAKEWFIKAKNLNQHAGAAAKLSEIANQEAEEFFSEGLQALKNEDREEAKACFARARDLTGHEGASAKLAEIIRQEAEEYYNRGYQALIDRQWGDAKKWLAEAEKLGHEDAAAKKHDAISLEREEIFDEGLRIFVEMNEDPSWDYSSPGWIRSKALFKKAADLGHKEAKKYLGDFTALECVAEADALVAHMQENGRTQEGWSKAKALYKKAADLGHEGAKNGYSMMEDIEREMAKAAAAEEEAMRQARTPRCPSCGEELTHNYVNQYWGWRYHCGGKWVRDETKVNYKAINICTWEGDNNHRVPYQP
jgi:hypothetical protein